ncbi:MAG: hypothetical protein ABII90_08380 [Bacteroidota bacterium]
MKKILIFVLLLCNTSLVFSQSKERTNTMGLDIRLIRNSNIEALNINYNLTFKRHNISVGPLFNMYPLLDLTDPPSNYPFWGMNIAYSFFPNKSLYFLDLYFFIDFQFVSMSDDSESLKFFNSKNDYIFQPSLGYSFNAYLTKKHNLYLLHRIGLGYYYRYSKFDNYRNSYLAGLLSLGLGYNVLFIKKETRKDE